MKQPTLTAAYPHLVAEWDPANDRTPDQVTAGSNYRAHWICAAGHHWQAAVASRTRGTGCPACANRIPTPGVNDLATTHPHLVAEWDADLNDRSPDQVTAGSAYRANWVCPAGHRWRVPVYHRTAGSGCPTCANRIAIPGVNDLASTHPHLAAEWDPEHNDRTPDQVTAGSHYRAHWICGRGHRFSASTHNRAAGSGCPTCSHRPPIPEGRALATTHPTLAAEWDPANDLTPDQVTAGSSRYLASWICPAGHHWEATVRARTKAIARGGCPLCPASQRQRRSLTETHPTLAAEWDPANDLTPDQVTAGSGYLASWVCAVGHHWHSPVKARTRVTPALCPHCTEPPPAPRSLTETHPHLIPEWDRDRNDRTSDQVTAGSHYRAYWICAAAGHTWQAFVFTRARGSGCPGCRSTGRGKARQTPKELPRRAPHG